VVDIVHSFLNARYFVRVKEMKINIVGFLPKDNLLRGELCKKFSPTFDNSFPWKSIWSLIVIGIAIPLTKPKKFKNLKK
jgi:hypothetical protein